MASTTAQIAKDKGNAAFKSGDYPAAIGHYTDAILADAKDATFPLNRAATYLKLGKNEDAERDCTTVLSLSPKNVKALFRRGQARIASGKLAEAQKDFEQATKLEPSNVAVTEELKKIKDTIQRSRAKPRKSPISVEAPPLSSSEVMSTPTTTTLKRRRIPITIVEAASPVSPQKTSTAASSSSPAMNNAASLLTPVSSRPLSRAPLMSPTQPAATTQSGSATPASPASAPAKPASFKEAKQARETAKPSRTGGGIFRASGQHTIFPERLDAPQAASAPPPSATHKGELAASLLPALAMSTETKAPMTSFMFVKSWETLKDPLKRWKLLTQIPPLSIPSLFQDSLEAHVLASLLQTLAAVIERLSTSNVSTSNEVRRWVQAYMTNLAKVPRFGTLVLFMSAGEKETARKVIKAISEAGMPADGWQKV